MDQGRMTGHVFGQAAQADRRGSGLGIWHVGPPPPAPQADPAPAATPAAPAPPAPTPPGAPSLLERVAEGHRLGDGDLATAASLSPFERELNTAVAGAGAQRTASSPTLDGRGWQRPATVEPGDLGDLAGRMHAARDALTAGPRRSGVVGAAGQDAPSWADQMAMEQQLGALIAQDPRARRAAPEPGSLAGRVADLERRARADVVSPEEGLALGNEVDEVFGLLNSEVQAAQAAHDPFGTFAPRAVLIDEQLLERAAADPLGLSAAEASNFEQQLNAQIAELARDPDAARPVVQAPAASPAGQQPAGDDPLAGASPEAILAALQRLGVDPQTLAGLVADDEGGEG